MKKAKKVTKPVLSLVLKCNKCGYEWNTAPNNILKGRRCPRCAGNIKLTHEEFLKRI